MDCLVLPCYAMMRRSRSRGSRLGYEPLKAEVNDGDGFHGGGDRPPVMVVVGKEERVFLVEPFVLEEYPFKVLMEMMKKKEKIRDDQKREKTQKRTVFVDDVDSILFEHMLWLMYNDFSSFFNLNLEEIIEFYAQDS